MSTGTRNLTRTEAAERARLVSVTSYDIALELSGDPDERTFRSRTEIVFSCSEPGASTFVEVAAAMIRSVTLNGRPVDTTAWSPERGLVLARLAAENALVVDADFPYSVSGHGLHRVLDPADGEVYLYSDFEAAHAQRVFAAFDQPDLKAEFGWRATVPAHWQVLSTMPVESVTRNGARKTVHLARSPRMSTYVTALCAGPYHRVTETHDGVELGIHCRRSMARYLDAAEIFRITREGFDFFHEWFGVRYPLATYDQIFVPEYNYGAMENFGCVVLAESRYVFRSQATDLDHEQRALTILHELAHMWFGDLVTLRWWDDLWLNEAFADWAAYRAMALATRFTGAWTTFMAAGKTAAYQQDQLSTTHPVQADAPDVDAAELNFDRITYVKGASVIKQLAAYVGIDAFTAGLRAYFATHGWGNAGFADLLRAIERSSARSLRDFAAQWLETTRVDTLRLRTEVGPDGRYTSVAIAQETPGGQARRRTHRVAVGRYELDGGRLVRRERLELELTGELTAIPRLTGAPAADVLLLNDDDLTYAKVRLDDRSMAAAGDQVRRFDDSLARALYRAVAWDMTRDAELAARDHVALALREPAAEPSLSLLKVTLGQVADVLTYYADPAWAPIGWESLARAAGRSLAAAPAGGGAQRVWAFTYASAARTADDLRVLRRWLAGTESPAGLAVDTDLRWHLLRCLVANGAAGDIEIDAELERDRTASGAAEAAMAGALVPTPAAKAGVWRRLTRAEELPNWQCRSLLLGFQHPAQTELTAPYAERFFDEVAGVWRRREGLVAQTFARQAYPSHQVDAAVVAASERWLAGPDRPAPLRRLIAEGRDQVARALMCRACDARAAG